MDIRIALFLMTIAPPMMTAADDGLRPTFYLSFDDGAQPDICSMGTKPTMKGAPKFVPGKRGKAIAIEEGCSLAFPTKGNLNKKAGTVAVWVKAADPQKERPKYARIFEMSLPAEPRDALMLIYPNHSIVYGVVRSGGKKCTPWPLGEATVFGDEWQHYALTWGPDGAAFHMNGVTLTGSVSMPPLSGLADLFFVGCDREGLFPACTAIDELCIFDRPLRSHELCRVAGITPESDLSRPNLVRNSSFEVGQDQWIIYPRADFYSEVSIDDSEAFHGHHSLLIDRRKAEGKPWSSIVAIGPWIQLDKGLEVTFSAYMKSDKPGTTVRMLIQRGVQGRTIENMPEEKEIGRYLTVGTEWKRYSITGELALAYKDGYRPMIHAMTMGSRLRIDAAQLSVGGERPYETFADIEIGGDSGRSDALFDFGGEVNPHAYVFNNCSQERRVIVRFKMKNPYGYQGCDGERQCRVAATSGYEIDLPRFTPKFRGQYRIQLLLSDEEGKLLDERNYALGVIKSHIQTPSPETSPFGVHGSAGEKGRRIGIKQLRDVSGTNWKWIEPKKGDYQMDFRERRFKRDQRLGYVHVQTIGRAPEWASIKGTDGISASVAEWKGYVRQVVSRFKPYVKTWEVWNEPNLNDYFKEHPDYYIKLLKVARETAKEVDPECTIIGICLAGVGTYGTPWLEKIFDLGALQYMAGIALHPYRKEPPEKSGFVESLRKVKEMMREHGGEKPMYFTEFGVGGTEDRRLFIPWYCGSRKWNEEEEAQLFVRTNVLSLAEGAKYLYWYKWLCERQQVGPDTNGFFRPDAFYTPKKLVLAYNELIWQLERAPFDSRIDTLSPAQHAYAFRRGHSWVTVLWDEDGQSAIMVRADGESGMFDIWGNAKDIERRNNGILVQLAECPVYLVTRTKPIIADFKSG